MLKKNGKRGITIIISHRLSAIKEADMIFVLDQGRIVEKGNHHELISGDTRYKKLFREQTEKKETAEAHDENIFPFTSKKIGGKTP